MAGRSLDADIIVVGGGPAGSAAAIAAAMRGFRVILLERETGARDKPGETLHPGVELLLAQLGLAGRLAAMAGARHRGVWIEAAGTRRFEPFGSDASGAWLGFQVWRADLDALLLAHAASLGVEVRRGCAPSAPLLLGGTVCGVYLDGHDITAGFVVDATGSARWLGRRLAIASPPRSPVLIARYGYRRGSCPARDDAPLLAGDASGWTWTARVRPDLYQWTRIRFGDGEAADGPPAELHDLVPQGRARGADVTWRLAARTAGPGWFMVGDAAAMLDPTSSHGVLKGLMSGMMAAHLIAAGRDGSNPVAGLDLAYHRWLSGWFEADIGELGRFHRAIGAAGF